MNDVAGKRYLGGIAVDVTGRKRIEEALRQAEERYRNIFEHAVEGIFQTTREGRYITVNPALARLYGYESPEEMLTTVRDIARQIYVDPRRREEFIRLVEDQGAITGFESQVARKDAVRFGYRKARVYCGMRTAIWSDTKARRSISQLASRPKRRYGTVRSDWRCASEGRMWASGIGIYAARLSIFRRDGNRCSGMRMVKFTIGSRNGKRESIPTIVGRR